MTERIRWGRSGHIRRIGGPEHPLRQIPHTGRPSGGIFCGGLRPGRLCCGRIRGLASISTDMPTRPTAIFCAACLATWPCPRAATPSGPLIARGRTPTVPRPRVCGRRAFFRRGGRAQARYRAAPHRNAAPGVGAGSSAAASAGSCWGKTLCAHAPCRSTCPRTGAVRQADHLSQGAAGAERVRSRCFKTASSGRRSRIDRAYLAAMRP